MRRVDTAYGLAKALNESSSRHAVCEDIFYSPRHAGETGAVAIYHGTDGFTWREL